MRTLALAVFFACMLPGCGDDTKAPTGDTATVVDMPATVVDALADDAATDDGGLVGDGSTDGGVLDMTDMLGDLTAADAHNG